MSTNYGEFEGTELDPSFDLDLEDEEQSDLVPILGISALLAAVVGAILVIAGRRRNPTPQERVEEFLKDAGKQGKKALRDVSLSDLLDDATSRARSAASSVPTGQLSSLLGEAM